MARTRPNPDAPFQSITGAARLTGLSRYYIRCGCQDGTIPHIKVGSDFRINMGLWREQLDRQSMEARTNG